MIRKLLRNRLPTLGRTRSCAEFTRVGTSELVSCECFFGEHSGAFSSPPWKQTILRNPYTLFLQSPCEFGQGEAVATSSAEESSKRVLCCLPKQQADSFDWHQNRSFA
jgi:hypothetical protein